MTVLENRSRPPGRLRRLGVLAIATAALLAGAGSFVGADPAPAAPAGPATAANLAPKWTSHFGRGKYRASPVVAGSFVYIGDEDGYLTKLPLATGTASPEPGKFAPTWTTDACFNSIFAKPAVGNGKVFVGTAAGYVCAFDDATGAFIWRQAMPNGGWANGPVLVGDTLYATGTNGAVSAFDAGTGTPRWSANLGVAGEHPWVTGPTVLGGKVYVGTSDGRAMRVTPPATAGAPATVTTLQPPYTGGQINDVIATDGVNLYFSVDFPTAPSVGEVHVVSLTPDGGLRWRVPTGLDPTYNGLIQAPAVAGGVVYAPTKFGILYLRSDNGGWITLADTSPNQPTTPTIANGVAYAGGVQGSGVATGALQAFDAQSGIPLYYAHTPTVANTVPAVAPDGTVLLGGGNSGQGAGVLWAYAPATPRQNT